MGGTDLLATMDPARWRVVRDALESLLELEPFHRAEQLAAIDDPAMRDILRGLLDKMGAPGGALDQGAAGAVMAGGLPAEPEATDPFIGRRLGDFRIECLLGSGGMGRVYRARRSREGVDQLAAIKLVLSPDPALRQRFERERSILSALNHPGIAQLIDIGSSDDGLPYLVMPYVDGVSIADYCASKRLGLAERLELMLKVAQGLSYAHRNLVVHRDIKPSNILVSADGNPTLLDFGIAKLLDGSSELVLTQFGAGPLTSAYAAPEQFNGGAISVATDIYQFGVLLYRLVSGRLPYEASTEDSLAWARAVVEAAPRTLARALRDSSPAVDAVDPREVGVDLETILRKALSKDPAARYSSIDAFAADIQAYLQGKPVLARRGGAGYFALRFVQRHATVVGIVVAGVLGLLATTSAALYQSRLALAEADRARAAVDFVNEVFRAADPSMSLASRNELANMLDLAAERMMPRLRAHPELSAPLSGLIGRAWSELGRMDRALPLFELAVGSLGVDVELSAAERLDILERALLVAQRSGRRDLAEHWMRLAEPLQARVAPERAALVADAIHTVRWALAIEDGRYADSLASAEAVLLAAAAAESESRDDLRLRGLHRSAVSLSYLARHAEARVAADASHQLSLDMLGEDHPVHLRNIELLGWVLLRSGRAGDALELLLPARERLVRQFGEVSQDFATYMAVLGEALFREGQQEAALEALRVSAAIYEETAGEHSAQAGNALLTAAQAELERGNRSHASELLARVEGHWQSSVAERAPVRSRLHLVHAWLEQAEGRVETAAWHAQRAIELASGLPDHAEIAQAAGRVLEALGTPDAS